MNIKIVVAAHKPYKMPEGNIYLPVFVGAKGKEDIGYTRDDSGDNISEKNPGFCELTGLYYAWKNVEADYLGLAHYRRHFSVHKNKTDKWGCLLTDTEAEALCKSYDIITPGKRKYYIESLYSHYEHTLYIDQLDLAREIISERYPEFLPAYDLVVKRTWGYMFNMYIMRRDLSDEYCSFIYDILFKVEKRYHREGMNTFHARFYGRISEILYNVWLYKKLTDNPSLRLKELDCVYMEDENWGKKIKGFLAAKFTGKKY